MHLANQFPAHSTQAHRAMLNSFSVHIIRSAADQAAPPSRVAQSLWRAPRQSPASLARPASLAHYASPASPASLVYWTREMGHGHCPASSPLHCAACSSTDPESCCLLTALALVEKHFGSGFRVQLLGGLTGETDAERPVQQTAGSGPGSGQARHSRRCCLWSSGLCLGSGPPAGVDSIWRWVRVVSIQFRSVPDQV